MLLRPKGGKLKERDKEKKNTKFSFSSFYLTDHIFLLVFPSLACIVSSSHAGEVLEGK